MVFPFFDKNSPIKLRVLPELAPILNCNGKYNQGELMFNFLHPKTFQTKFVPFSISYMEIGKQNLVQNPFSVFKEYENEI
jgi:hypothetical protein